MVYESSIEFRRYLCYLLSTRKQLLFCISVFCICQICFSLVPKSPVPTTLLTELSSLIPLRRSVSRREVNNQFVKSRRLQLAMCRISESEVSPDNFYTSSREGASTLHESHYIPSGYEGARVLLVGDGDLSFAASLSTLRICQSLLATTWDSKERLVKSFPRAAENIRIIEENGDTVQYEVDATDLQAAISRDCSFDTIAWNFPHIAGKQNIKRNRELIQNFLVSSFNLLNSKSTEGRGTVKIALCDGQSGTKALNMDDWNFSWKLVHQAAEACCLLTGIEDFPLESFPGYKVTGHRGHGGDFPTGTAPQLFSFKRSASDAPPNSSHGASASVSDTKGPPDVFTSESRADRDEGQMHYEALQAPSYIHEVHLLAVTMVSDLMDLERRAREGVKLIIAHFEEEEERERVIGGTERADAIDRIRRGKQLVPVRRRYRTQADRDEMALAKLAISEGSLPDNDQNRDKDKDSDSDSDSAGDDNSLDVKGTSVEDTLLDTAIGDTTSSGLSLSLDNLAASRHNSSVWAVNLVDVYTCPRTQQISHAFQVTYCSLTRPIGRTVADRYRERVERDLPIYLGMVPRVVKHGGLVSLSYPWYVTSAVRTILASSSSNSPLGPRNSESKSDESIMASEVDVSDLSIILRELERQERSPASSESPRDLVIGAGVGASALNVAGSDDAPASSAVDSISEDQLDGREKIRTIARSLWRRRVGVLMQADFKSVPSTLPKA